MTCDDYLSMLETLPVNELAHGEAREHAAVCHDCNRVTRVVAERERNMLMAYGDVMPMAASPDVAMTAIATARRRRIAFLYRIGLGVAAAATAVFVFATVVVPKPRRVMAAQGREQILLRCLSGFEAADLLRANLTDAPDVAITVPPSGRIVMVQGNGNVRVRARAIIDEYENACRVRTAR